MNKPITLSAILCAASLCCVAIADGTKAPPPQGAPDGGDGGALKGPQVPDDAKQGKGKFGDGADRKRGKDGKPGGGPGMAGMGGMGEALVQARVAREAMKSVKDQLTPEQNQKIDDLLSGFEDKLKEFKDANNQKLEELRQKMKAGKDSPMGPDPALMEEMETLAKSAPKFDATQQEVFAVLTSDQQTKVKARAEEIRKEIAERAKRDGSKRDGSGPDGKQRKRPDGKGLGAGPNDKPAKSPPGQDPPKDPPFNFDDPKKPN